MRRTRSVVPIAGLTIIEVLVALTLLSVVAVAVVGSFSLIVSVNRDTSVDVDLSRVVRSVTEKVVDDWEDFNNFDNELVSGLPLEDAANPEDDYMYTATAGRCSATVSTPDVATVKLVTIVCQGSDDLDEQTYYVEVGDPQP